MYVLLSHYFWLPYLKILGMPVLYLCTYIFALIMGLIERGKMINDRGGYIDVCIMYIYVFEVSNEQGEPAKFYSTSIG